MLQPTRWRIVISCPARTLTVNRNGHRLRRFRVVVGAPATPTPHGLFSIVGVWRWNPTDFLGIHLATHRHSIVCKSSAAVTASWAFTSVARSLVVPLGRCSYGCIVMSNNAIEWIVHKVGAENCRHPGTRALTKSERQNRP